MNQSWKRAFTSWPPRKIASLGLGFVSVDAGQISYAHGYNVMAAHFGLHVVSSPLTVAWGEPALADVCIVSGTFNLIDALRRKDSSWRNFPYLTLAGILVSAFVTLWMNVDASKPLAVPVWCVNGWPPVAFGLALESFLSLLRRKASDPAEIAADAAKTMAPRDALAVFLATGSRRDVAADVGVSHATIQTLANALNQPTPSLNGASHA